MLAYAIWALVAVIVAAISVFLTLKNYNFLSNSFNRAKVDANSVENAVSAAQGELKADVEKLKKSL